MAHSQSTQIEPVQPREAYTAGFITSSAGQLQMPTTAKAPSGPRQLAFDGDLGRDGHAGVEG
jgi:hypothetical protein